MIIDTGMGIPPEQMQRLFDPDFTTKGVRVRAGLGLFTSYIIIEKHRGQINVHSEVARGTTFTIILPMEMDTSNRKVKKGKC